MKNIFLLFFLSLLVFACGNKPEKDSQSQSNAFDVERETFFNSLRNPDEAAAKLIPGIAAFDSSMLNNPEHFFQYVDNDVKAAANLGIYMSDLNYCILLKQGPEIKRYFNAVFELSKAIRVEKNILEFLMNRYQTNIEKNDSVRLVVSQLFNQSTLGLQGTDRERLAGIAMAGYQIENLHLALTTLKSLPATLTNEQIKTQKELIQFILDQRGKFEVVYNFVRANSDPLDPDANPNYPFFDHALRELIGVYHNVTEHDTRVDELSEKVEAIRNKLISMR